MLKSTMDENGKGLYDVALLDDGVTVATALEPMSMDRAIRWIDRAVVDYRLAQQTLERHGDAA